MVGHQDDDLALPSRTKFYFEDLRNFKAQLPVSTAASPTKGLTEYEQFDPRLPR
ncbi:hypothetical protein F5883DRAFT_654249 [Diaporthe sp. PMI_573]|nr:hypothetical protein F5883DRAFT_654249 [Diaporthaceae sp. PMI_573]